MAGYSRAAAKIGDDVILLDRESPQGYPDCTDSLRSQPIVSDKLLAYAFILTHEGVPCIFWKDYYHYGLALAGSAHGIDRLCQVHRDYGGGWAQVYAAPRGYAVYVP